MTFSNYLMLVKAINVLVLTNFKTTTTKLVYLCFNPTNIVPSMKHTHEKPFKLAKP